MMIIRLHDGSEPSNITVDFYCPCCGEDGAGRLIHGAIFASPSEPAIICCRCYAAFRIGLYEVEGEVQGV